jgi:hypothetical protein
MALSSSENVLTASVALIVLIIGFSPVKYDYRILHIYGTFFNTFFRDLHPKFLLCPFAESMGLDFEEAGGNPVSVIHFDSGDE